MAATVARFARARLGLGAHGWRVGRSAVEVVVALLAIAMVLATTSLALIR